MLFIDYLRKRFFFTAQVPSASPFSISSITPAIGKYTLSTLVTKATDHTSIHILTESYISTL